jgi:hypothetical protein
MTWLEAVLLVVAALTLGGLAELVSQAIAGRWRRRR